MKRKYILLLFIFIVLSPLLFFQNAQTIDYNYHIVKPGDSLYKIAIEYHTTVNIIRKLNNIYTDLIYPGQRIKVSLKNNDNTNDYYIVQAGDSLYKISQMFNISISTLKNINNLSSDIIYIGQSLLIREKDNLHSISGQVNFNNKSLGTQVISEDHTVINEILPLKINPNLPRYTEDEIIVKYKPVSVEENNQESTDNSGLITINSLDTKEGKIVHYRVPEGEDINEFISEYKEFDNVAWVEPNYIFYTTAVPSDSYYNYQWGHINVNLEAAWDIEKGSENVTVAVIDTGVITTHPDLTENLLPGVDFVGGKKTYPIEDYDITDYDPTDETKLVDGGSHGTHVAGIIGAVTNNNKGIAGVNWQVSILPIRALTRKGGTSWDIAEGIYYAIDKNVDIINLSLGSNHQSSLQHEAVKTAVNKGITVIAAAGNENSSVYYPAAFLETIAVGAVNENNRKASYSNYGPEVDLVAPGGDYGNPIYSTWGYYEEGKTVASYTGMMGTSMATPYVSGIAALLKAHGINDPNEIKERLISTAKDLGEEGKDNTFGYGLVDAHSALLEKKNNQAVVFTGTIDGKMIKTKSEVKKINYDRSFRLEEVQEGKNYVFAWLDINNDNIIDSGDYFGKTENELIVDKDINGLKIDLFYIPAGIDSPLFTIEN